MTKKIPMTPDGYKRLQEKLKYLKQVERPKNVQDIEVARDKGDLSENAEYDAAKERQGHLSQQIQEIEHKLSLAQVIDPKTISSDRVVFGATVTLSNIDNEEEVKYFIVGTDESDIASGKISIESPIARALIGKEEGDEIKVNTPGGTRNFEIINIEFV
jgi:transcription elongation factor GreA